MLTTNAIMVEMVAKKVMIAKMVEMVAKMVKMVAKIVMVAKNVGDDWYNGGDNCQP